MDDLNEQLGLDLPEDGEYDTIAGFVLAELGRIPARGDVFESPSARFTMLEASQRTIERLRVEVLEPVTVKRNGNGNGNGHDGEHE